ncbi:hypothetical protein ACFQ1S_07635 [Kibdelosporangium lantanae]|uniref:Uncharacterized protein n=1 Tax=Kibdelosporangium lantanae TaxID=1497396 RepID=A0ABW3M454_9PSEU
MDADELGEILKAVRSFVRDEVVPREDEIEETDTIPDVLRRQAADNEMYIDWETATGKNTFDPVPNRVSDPNQPDPSATDPFVAPFINSNGQTFMICFRSATTNAPRFYSRKL